MEDPFGFPPPPPPPPKRYTDRSPHRTWLVLEDLVLWPAILDRGSRGDYDTTCEWLCNRLCRVPIATKDRMRAESVALVEMRTVTRHLENPPPLLIDRARELLAGYRTGRLLSWTERVEVLVSYERKLENNRERIPLLDLLALLGRDESDLEYINGYLAVIQNGDIDDDAYATPIPDLDVTARLMQLAIASGAPTRWCQFIHSCQGI